MSPPPPPPPPYRPSSRRFHWVNLLNCVAAPFAAFAGPADKLRQETVSLAFSQHHLTTLCVLGLLINASTPYYSCHDLQEN